MQLDDNLLQSVLYKTFAAMHYYRNNTKKKVIPSAILKAVLVFFATFMVNHGCQRLIQAADGIQKGILFMILKSCGDKIKLCGAPARDRKYAIVAYTNLLMEALASFENETVLVMTKAIGDLCAQGGNDIKFTVATNVEGNIDDMLADGIVDTSVKFARMQHYELKSAKVEKVDKLTDIKSPESFFIERMNQLAQANNVPIEQLVA